jgi:hypothetical protein
MRDQDEELSRAINACMAQPATNEFHVLRDGRYRLTLPSFGVTFEIDRLRRDRHELVGELCVRCELPGARTINGILSVADFNVSSARARTERARFLLQRSNATDIDWVAFVEDFCQRVLSAERTGQPAVDLRMLPRPEPDDMIKVEGFAFSRRHPTIIFGDGGAAKSYTALWLAGRMVDHGLRVALFDWELAGDDHRDRLERLFPDGMPRIVYARCERPLVHEADRLRRIVRDEGIDYAVFDSVAFACDGPPESAEIVSAYFRAVRQIGVGSLQIAHINRSDHADQKPFGSTFWHNGARATWFVKRADQGADSDAISLGFVNRKANLARLQKPVGFTVTFTEQTTKFERSDVAENPELAGMLSVRQRMVRLLQRGPMTPAAIAEEIDAEVETVKWTARRHKDLFVLVDNSRLGLMERKAV